MRRGDDQPAVRLLSGGGDLDGWRRGHAEIHHVAAAERERVRDETGDDAAGRTAVSADDDLRFRRGAGVQHLLAPPDPGGEGHGESREIFRGEALADDATDAGDADHQAHWAESFEN